jgi:hypothetical protein
MPLEIFQELECDCKKRGESCAPWLPHHHHEKIRGPIISSLEQVLAKGRIKD